VVPTHPSRTRVSTTTILFEGVLRLVVSCIPRMFYREVNTIKAEPLEAQVVRNLAFLSTPAPLSTESFPCGLGVRPWLSSLFSIFSFLSISLFLIDSFFLFSFFFFFFSGPGSARVLRRASIERWLGSAQILNHAGQRYKLNVIRCRRRRLQP